MSNVKETTTAVKHNKKFLTIEEKLHVINDYEKNSLSLREVAVKYKIGKSTVSDIVRKRKKYEEESSLRNPQMKIAKRCRSQCDLNDHVYNFILMANNSNFSISGPIIQAKASLLAEEMGISNFKASDGWLARFKRRYNVKTRERCTESNKTKEICDNWQSKLKNLTQNYPPDCVYNCNETGLLFKAIPTANYFTKFTNYCGPNIAKHRITVLLACNATGEKLKPLVIGKAVTPNCFKQFKFNLSNSPVHYFSNSSTMMTKEIFHTWLRCVNNEMKEKGKKVLLFLNSSRAHLISNQNFEFVKLSFFPVNVTSTLQPLDTGVMRLFKAKYRQLLLVSLAADMEMLKTPKDFSKSVKILDAINWISEAWSQVPQSVVSKSFALAGFEILNDGDDEMNEETVDFNTFFNTLQLEDQVDFDTFVSADNELETDEVEYLIRKGKRCNKLRNRDVIVESEESDEEIVYTPSLADAKNAADVLKQFAVIHDIDPMTSISKVSSLINNMIVSEKIQSQSEK